MDELQTRIEALKLAQDWVLAFEGPHEDVFPLADLYVDYLTGAERKINRIAVMEFVR